MFSRTVIGNPPVKFYFAQFGENRLKPTDIWGRHPTGFKDSIELNRDNLVYEKAPRGSQTGTQGMSSAEDRAEIPYAFSLAICKLCEDQLNKKQQFAESVACDIVHRQRRFRI